MTPDSARRATFPPHPPPTPMRVGPSPSPSAVKIPLAAADLRAAFKAEIARLAARPIEGGPDIAIREGVLLAWMPEDFRAVVVDGDTIAALRRLPDCAGADAVAGVLAP